MTTDQIFNRDPFIQPASAEAGRALFEAGLSYMASIRLFHLTWIFQPHKATESQVETHNYFHWETECLHLFHEQTVINWLDTAPEKRHQSCPEYVGKQPLLGGRKSLLENRPLVPLGDYLRCPVCGQRYYLDGNLELREDKR